MFSHEERLQKSVLCQHKVLVVIECITLHLVLFPDLSLRDTLGSYPLQFLHLSEVDGGGGGRV